MQPLYHKKVLLTDTNNAMNNAVID